MNAIDVRIMRLPHAADLPLPTYQSAQAAGLDLAAAVPMDSPIKILPGKWAAIPTGLAIALPSGTEAQVRPRSGLAASYGISVLNAPGTIDADFRGEIKILLVNFGPETFEVRRGMRIAQLVLAHFLHAKLVESEGLDPTTRGRQGFGSTGGG